LPLAACLFLSAFAGCQSIVGLDGLKPGDSGGGPSGQTTGSGASGGAGGTGGAGGMTTMPSGSGGAPMCPMLPKSTCNSEPGYCNGTCQDGGATCEVDCPGVMVCTNPPMDKDLPCLGPNKADMDCRFKCTGSGSCTGKTIRCPPGKNRCEIVCDGMGACDQTTIDCPLEGDCVLQCKNGGCSPQTKLECGAGKCDVTCGTGANDGSAKPGTIDDSKACEKSVQGCP
jgi:hypothetical protein